MRSAGRRTNVGPRLPVSRLDAKDGSAVAQAPPLDRMGDSGADADAAPKQTLVASASDEPHRVSMKATEPTKRKSDAPSEGRGFRPADAVRLAAGLRSAGVAVRTMNLNTDRSIEIVFFHPQAEPRVYPEANPDVDAWFKERD